MEQPWNIRMDRRWRNWPFTVALALGLMACAPEYFTNDPEPGAVAYSGTTSSGRAMDEAGCGAYRFDMTVTDDEIITGTAEPENFERTGDLRDIYNSWWLDGVVYPNGTALFTLKNQPTPFEGIRATSVWRGEIVDDVLVAAEQPPGCLRAVSLERGNDAPDGVLEAQASLD